MLNLGRADYFRSKIISIEAAGYWDSILLALILFTKIKTVRNELVTIPNQTLLQNQIVNYSGMDLLATSVETPMTYQNNRKVVESLLIDAAKNTEGITPENPAPYVLI